MMSPFPGMDPYLEDPIWWPGVHNRIITYLSGALNRELPPTYVANIEERLYVAETERQIISDLTVSRRVVESSVRPLRGGAALMDRVAAPEILTLVTDDPQKETYIQIQEPRGGTVIAVIEVLSYSNKSSDNEGRRLYLNKQQEVLHSSAHLLEIDLLRAGRHTVSAPLGPMEIRFQHWDYLICLSRGFNRHRFETWPLSLRKPLPVIWLPLKLENEGVAVDLQTVLNRVFDEGAYDRILDYTCPPFTPLRREDALWADRLLRKKGLRP